MKALVLTEDLSLELTEMPKPSPKPDELLIRTYAATICTSDLNDIAGNPFGIKLPMILGHEGAGVVEAVGSETIGFHVGDKVAAHPVIPCGDCVTCRRGLGHLCEQMGHLGLDRGGVFADYFTIRADRARLMPPELDFAEAALMEPVCVCIEAVERANIPQGGTVLVIGDGPFGVMIANLCAERKSAKVILQGGYPFRMERARNVAATVTPGPDALSRIREVSGPDGVDSAILCVDREEALDTGIEALRPRGTLSIFSSIHGKVPVNMLRVHVKELNLCGSCNDTDFLDEALAWLASGGAAGVITHRMPVEQYRTAFDIAANRKSEALKVCLSFGG